MEKTPPLYFFFPAVISYGIINILAVARDLGKTKTLVLSGIVFVLQVGMAIISTVDKIGIYRGGSLFTHSATNHTLAVVLFVMMFFKYRDKAQRKGTAE